MMGQWKLSLRNLRRNRRRSIATVLSIALGAGGLLFTFGYITRGERYLRVTQTWVLHSGHLAIYKDGALDKSLAKPEVYDLSPEEAGRLRELVGADPNVERIASYLTAAGLLTNGCKSQPYRAVGVDPETERWIYAQPELVDEAPELARFVQGDGLWAWGDLEGAVGLSTGLAAGVDKTRVYGELGEAEREARPLVDCDAPDAEAQLKRSAGVQLLTTTFDGAFTAMDAQIVGVFNPAFTEFERSGLVLPLTALQALHETEAITYLAVYLKDRSDIEAKAAALEAQLRAQGLKVTVYPWNDARTSPQYTSTSQTLQILGTFIAIVVSSVVALTIVNTMTITILERRAELGMLRALGFNRLQTRRLVVVEALFLAVLGSVLGTALGYLGAEGVNALNLRIQAPSLSGTFQFMVKPTLLQGALICAALSVLAIGSAVVSTTKTLRQRIISLLQSGLR